MNRAILGIAPDAKQEGILSQVMPSWQRYAQRHQLEIVIVRRSITEGKHPYWDRWLIIQETEPEVARFDKLVLLDNDIYISDSAPDVFDYSGASGITAMEESAQQEWHPSQITEYYARFHVVPEARLPRPTKVFNFGVCLVIREARSVFKALYDKWRSEIQSRFTQAELKQRGIFYRLETDGPFLSYELQALGRISPLPPKFNFMLPSWLRKVGVRRLPFLLQAKLAQRAPAALPKSVVSALTSPARSAVQRAAAQCHFLHVAASKSPLWLLSQDTTH
ncbi:MAG: hypothetical protein ABI233_02380 [Chthoniobacterales bacterium]